MTMEDKKFKEAIDRLSKDTEKWNKIKEYLEDEIRSHKELIIYIDKIVKAREERIIKLN